MVSVGSALTRVPINDKVDKNGKAGYGSTVIPNRGALGYFLKLTHKDIAYTRIDHTNVRFHLQLLCVLLILEHEIIDILHRFNSVRNTIEKEVQ